MTRQELQAKLQRTLLDQSQARQLARLDNESGDIPTGMVAIAQTVPAQSWGGAEQGWTVVWGVPTN